MHKAPHKKSQPNLIQASLSAHRIDLESDLYLRQNHPITPTQQLFQQPRNYHTTPSQLHQTLTVTSTQPPSLRHKHCPPALLQPPHNRKKYVPSAPPPSHHHQETPTSILRLLQGQSQDHNLTAKLPPQHIQHHIDPDKT